MAGGTASPNLNTSSPIASGGVAVSATSEPVVTIALAETFKSFATCMVMPPLGAPMTIAVSSVEFNAMSCNALRPAEFVMALNELLAIPMPPFMARIVIALTSVEIGASISTALPPPPAEQLTINLDPVIEGPVVIEGAGPSIITCCVVTDGTFIGIIPLLKRFIDIVYTIYQDKYYQYIIYMASEEEILKHLYDTLGIHKAKTDKEQEIRDKQLLFNLYKVPKTDKGVNMPHTSQPNAGQISQADLLFLPDDNGFKYALVVVDTGWPKTFDVEPLKSKTQQEVLKAFKAIFARKNTPYPQFQIRVDSGNEFSGIVKKYFNDNKTYVHVAQVGRHRQVSMVEHMNGVLGKLLFQRMTAQELNTKVVSKEWVEFLPMIVKELNKIYALQKRKPTNTYPIASGDSNILLNEGDKVRVALDEPHDVATGVKLHGKFRKSDVRWENKDRTVEHILLSPNSPPLYLISGKHSVAYTKHQLQLIPKGEQLPPLSAQRKFVIEKILGKKTIKRKLYYEVKWQHRIEPTWEPANVIKQDVPLLVKQFEKN